MSMGFNKAACGQVCCVLPAAETAVLWFAVCELRSPSMSNFLEGLESSGWLKHIKAVLDAGIFIAKVSLEANPRCLHPVFCNL